MAASERYGSVRGGGAEGLCNDAAFRTLVDEVRELLDRQVTRQWNFFGFIQQRRGQSNVLRSVVLLACGVLLLASLAISVLFREYFFVEVRLLFEGLIILMLFVINAVLYIVEQRWLRLARHRRLEDHLQAFRARGTAALARGEDPFAFETIAVPASERIRVKRDGAWTMLPVNVLVAGDVVTLVEGRTLPCDLLRVSDGETFHRGEARTQLQREKSCMNITEPIVDEDLPEFEQSTAAAAEQASHSSGSSAVKYRLLSTPLVQLLEEYFAFSKDDLIVESFDKMSDPLSPALPLQKAKAQAERLCTLVLVASLAVALVVNVIHAAVQLGSGRALEYVVVRQVYLCLPLLFVSFLWLVRMMNSLANGGLLALFHSLQTNVVDWEAGKFYDDEDLEVEQKGSSISAEVPARLVARYALDLLFGFNRTLTGATCLSCSAYSASLAQLFGSITVVCCIDQSGILSDGQTYVEKMFFFENEEPTILELSRDLSAGGDAPRFHDPEGEDAEAAEGAKAPNFVVRFNDLSWREHLPSLKPLGLNFLLNSHCRFGEYNSRRMPTSVDSLYSVKVHDSLCLCALGQRIGFSKGALDNFEPVKEIYRFSHCAAYRDLLAELDEKRGPSDQRKSKVAHALEYGYDVFPEDPVEEEVKSLERLFYSVSTAVQDTVGGSIQLLSKGNSTMILESCGNVWHGNSIKPLTDSEVKTVMNYEEQWSSYECISFSYQPVEPYYHPVILGTPSHPNLPGQSPPPSEERQAADQMEVGDESDEQGDPAQVEAAQRSASVYSEDGGGKRPRDGGPPTREDLIDEMQQDQIFIGMIAMRQLPRFEVEGAIKTIRKTGTHFTFFTADGPRPSKLFAERLGLETDWNCSINLEESEERQHDNTPSRLPRGINAIKKHIAEVDDVPLRIPLFYNSTKPACAEMVKVFQENGEVVCVVGNAFRLENLPSFQQADLAIGFQSGGNSGCTACCDDDSSEFEEDSDVLLSSAFFLEASTTDSFSVDTTTLPCQLVMHQFSSIGALPLLIRSGRRYLSNIESSLTFYLGALLALHFCLLASYLLFLPTIFHGVMILWFLLFTIPVLCLSLVLSPSSGQEMSQINPKRNQPAPKALAFLVQRYAMQLVPLVPIVLLLFTAAFAGAWWTNGSARGLFGFGPEAQTQAYHTAVRIGQNVAGFVFVLFLCAWGMTFVQNTAGLFSSPRRFLCVPYLLGACLVLAMQVLFMAVDVNLALPQLLARGLYPIVASLAWVPAVFVLDEIWKRRHQAHVNQDQQFMWLEFDTKLGMHSPVSPFL